MIYLISTKLDYTKDDWGTVLEGKDFDSVYDCVGKLIIFFISLLIAQQGGLKNWQSSEKILKKGGIFVTLTGDNEDQKKISIGGLLSSAGTKLGRNIRSSFTGSPQYESILTDPNGRDLTKIAELIESEKVKTVRYFV